MFPSSTTNEEIFLDTKPWTDALKATTSKNLIGVLRVQNTSNLPPYPSDPSEIDASLILRFAAKELEMLGVDTWPVEVKSNQRCPFLGLPGPPLSPTDAFEAKVHKLANRGFELIRWLRNATSLINSAEVPALHQPKLNRETLLARKELWVIDTSVLKLNEDVLAGVISRIPDNVMINKYLMNVRKETSAEIKNAAEKFFKELELGLISSFRLKALLSGLIKLSVKYDSCYAILECAPCLAMKASATANWTKLNLDYATCSLEEKKKLVSNMEFRLTYPQECANINARMIKAIEQDTDRQILVEQEELAKKNAVIEDQIADLKKYKITFKERRLELKQTLEAIVALYGDFTFVPTATMLSTVAKHVVFRNIQNIPDFLRPSFPIPDLGEFELSFFRGMNISIEDYFKLLFLYCK